MSESPASSTLTEVDTWEVVSPNDEVFTSSVTLLRFERRGVDELAISSKSACSMSVTEAWYGLGRAISGGEARLFKADMEKWRRNIEARITVYD